MRIQTVSRKLKKLHLYLTCQDIISILSACWLSFSQLTASFLLCIRIPAVCMLLVVFDWWIGMNKIRIILVFSLQDLQSSYDLIRSFQLNHRETD